MNKKYGLNYKNKLKITNIINMYPRDVIGSIVQFIAQKDIKILLAHSNLPNIFLAYDNLDFIAKNSNHKKMAGVLSKTHYELIKQNYNISDKALAVCASIVGDISVVKIKLLNNFYNTDLKTLFMCIDCVCICEHHFLAEILLKWFDRLFGRWAIGSDFDNDESKSCYTYERHIFRLALKLGNNKFMELLNKVTFAYHNPIEYIWYYYEKLKFGVVHNILNMTDILKINPKTYDVLLSKSIEDQNQELAYTLMNHPKVKFIGNNYETKKGFKKACQYGYKNIVEIYLRDGYDDDTAININSNNNHRFDIRWCIGGGFKISCTENKLDLLKVFMKLDSIKKSLDNMDVHYKYGQFSEVSIFEQNIYLGLTKAIKNGNAKIINYLLKDGRLDPSFSNYYLIRTAAKNNNIEIVEAIYLDGRGVPKNIQSNSRLKKIISQIK